MWQQVAAGGSSRWHLEDHVGRAMTLLLPLHLRVRVLHCRRDGETARSAHTVNFTPITRTVTRAYPVVPGFYPEMSGYARCTPLYPRVPLARCRVKAGYCRISGVQRGHTRVHCIAG